MGEEEVAVAASPAPSDHKRKLEDLEPEAPEPTVSSLPPVETEADENANANADANSKLNLNDVKNAIQNAEDVAADGSNPSEAKRPRLEEETDGSAVENGQQEEKLDEPEEASQQTIEENLHTEGAHQAPVETSQTMTNEPLPMDNHKTENTELSPVKIPQDGNDQDLSGGDNQQVVTESIPLQSNISSPPQHPMTDGQTVSRKMEVPNNKVGVLIGKAGDTIRFLQYNSGAKIQITRDADADPYSSTRPVELIGTLENINKAEKLIKDVIAEADAGGSPSLVARGFVTAQTGGDAEQIQIQVPNEKVGLIIGKGGETIKNLQTRSGARIQLIPQHLPEGDQSKERTVRVTGNKKQIEMAKEMIKEVMNQPVRSSPLSGVYNPQTYRTRGPSGPPQWGPRGPPHVQPTGYEYNQRGAYASQSPQFPPAAYGGYPSQQAPRGSFNAGWDQRPPASGQVAHHGGGYDYYGHGGGHMADASTPAPGSTPAPAPLGAPASAVGPPPTQVNYNYGHPQGQDYGLPASATYSQSMPSQQHGYGHGYDEPKYENQVPMQHGYGAHGNPQPVAYQQQVNTQPGYAQQSYGKPPTYGMPSQGPPPQQSYVPPRAGQPDLPYQGPVTSTPSYGPTAASQQTYPYPTSGHMQHTYPYGTAQPSNDGYNQAPPANTSANAYGPAVPGYGQPAGQTAPGYAQGGAAGGYGQYPSSQPAYNEQSVPNSAVYGYQGPTDAAYNTAPGAAYAGQSSGQSVYVQPTPNQPGYDQPVPQTGGYGGVPGSAPGLYGKGVSPQPGYAQYDSTQMYGGHH